MTGAEMIAAERRRQVEEEGWTPEHDDAQGRAEMQWAARCYLTLASWQANPDDQGALDQQAIARASALNWPWDASWWKPSDDPIRNLTKAGALIAAEIDRLQRAAEQEGE